jgi:hypothetical protein
LSSSVHTNEADSQLLERLRLQLERMNAYYDDDMPEKEWFFSFPVAVFRQGLLDFDVITKQLVRQLVFQPSWVRCREERLYGPYDVSTPELTSQMRVDVFVRQTKLLLAVCDSKTRALLCLRIAEMEKKPHANSTMFVSEKSRRAFHRHLSVSCKSRLASNVLEKLQIRYGGHAVDYDDEEQNMCECCKFAKMVDQVSIDK